MVRFANVPGATAEALAAPIPAERAHYAEPREAGIAEAPYLAADRSAGWPIVRAASEETARGATSPLPLSRLRRATFTPLAEA